MRLAASFTLIVFFAAACGSTPPAAPPEDQTPKDESLVASAVVGSAGGTVAGDGVTLEIPAGALDADTTIEVFTRALTSDANLTDADAASPFLEFRPSGLTFAKPVRVTLPTTRALTADDYVLWTLPQSNADYELIALTGLAPTFEVTHFSFGVIVNLRRIVHAFAFLMLHLWCSFNGHGTEGQGCCAWTCGTGLTCRAESNPLGGVCLGACGGEGQRCCDSIDARPACESALACSENRCSTPPAPPTFPEAGYALARDYTGANPNGPWSFGTGTGAAFTLHTEQPTDSNGWITPTTGANVWKNATETTSYGAEPGEVSMHPGTSGESSVTRWTAPIAGVGRVQVTFGAGDTGNTRARLLHNEAELLAGYPETASGGVLTYDEVRTFAAGDVLELVVDSVYYYGNTTVDVSITPATP